MAARPSHDDRRETAQVHRAARGAIKLRGRNCGETCRADQPEPFPRIAAVRGCGISSSGAILERNSPITSPEAVIEVSVIPVTLVEVAVPIAVVSAIVIALLEVSAGAIATSKWNDRTTFR